MLVITNKSNLFVFRFIPKQPHPNTRGVAYKLIYKLKLFPDKSYNRRITTHYYLINCFLVPIVPIIAGRQPHANNETDYYHDTHENLIIFRSGVILRAPFVRMGPNHVRLTNKPDKW